MKALILTAEGVEDSELFYPLYRLREAGVQTDVAAPEKGKVAGKHGITVEANLTLDQISDGYNLLVLPGGKGPEKVRLHPKALEVTRDFMQSGKPVAAICHGPQILISAQVIKGRKATCWPGVRDDLIAAGADYADKDVIVDRNLVTSRMPEDLPAFGREMMKLLQRTD